mgnify:CR=1 FL=1
MAKLYFRYGNVGSAKTLNLLTVAHTYRIQQRQVYLIKPAIDNRFGENCIKSRAGLEDDADLIVNDFSRINPQELIGMSCILVDEAQFLSRFVVDQLRSITMDYDIPAICYGLRTNFRSELVEGSKRLLEVADAIEEIKTTCYFCNRKGLFNLKQVNGVATLDGPVIDLGAEEKYVPACAYCYKEKTKPLASVTDQQTLFDSYEQNHDWI